MLVPIIGTLLIGAGVARLASKPDPVPEPKPDTKDETPKVKTKKPKDDSKTREELERLKVENAEMRGKLSALETSTAGGKDTDES